MPSKLAKSARAKVVVCGTRLIAETGKYVTTLVPITEIDSETDDVRRMQLINAALENLVKLAPEQYMWTFRWFQSRPDSGSSPYDAVKPN